MNDRATIKFKWNAGYLPCPSTTTEDIFEEQVILNWDGSFDSLATISTAVHPDGYKVMDIFECFKPEDTVVGEHQQFTVLEVTALEA